MEDPNAANTHESVELLERFRISLFRRDVVSGCQQMTGVEADANPGGTVQQFQDPRQVLEPVPEVRALTRGVLEEDHGGRVRTRTQQPRDAGSNQAQSFTFGSGRVRTGMHHQAQQTQRFGTVVLLLQGSLGLFAKCIGSCRKVDEIAVVRDDGCDAGVGDAPAEEHDLVPGQHARTPLPRRLGEDLKGFAARGDGAIHGAWQASAYGQVRAEPRHYSPNTSAANRYRRAPVRQASGGRPAFTQV